MLISYHSEGNSAEADAGRRPGPEGLGLPQALRALPGEEVVPVPGSHAAAGAAALPCFGALRPRVHRGGSGLWRGARARAHSLSGRRCIQGTRCILHASSFSLCLCSSKFSRKRDPNCLCSLSLFCLDDCFVLSTLNIGKRKNLGKAYSCFLLGSPPFPISSFSPDSIIAAFLCIIRIDPSSLQSLFQG